MRALPLLLTTVSLALGCSSKLPQPDELRAEGLGSPEEGRAIVTRGVDAHGGRETWDALGDVVFEVEDTWHGMASLGAPWPVSDPSFRLTYDFGLNKGRIEFDALPDEVWGFDSVEGWKQVGAERRYDGIEGVTFIVPTVAYFIASPFKFMDDGVFAHSAGRKTVDGRELDAVLLTFGEGVGFVQDRYEAFFDPETHQLVYVTFTVYEQSSIVEGDAWYTQWQQVGDLLLPKTIEIGGIRPITMDAHTLEVGEIDLAPDVKPGAYEKPDAR